MLLLQRTVLRVFYQTFQFSAQTQEAIANTNDPFQGLSQNIKGYKPLKQIPSQLQTINYENDIAPAIKIYQELGFNQNHLSRLWKINPFSLTISQNQDRNDIKQLTTFLKSNLDIQDKQIRSMLFKFPLLLKQSNISIEQQINLLREEMEMTNQQIKRILFFYPILFDGNLEKKVKTIKTLLEDYANCTPKESGLICSQLPYFLSISEHILLENLKLLHHNTFSSEEIKQILNKAGEVAVLQPDYFEMTIYHYLSLIPDKKQLKQVILKNPELLLQCPHTMIQPKIKQLQLIGFDNEQIGQILFLFPEIFLKSQGSIKQKLLYLKKHHNFDFQKDKFFPEILLHKYWEEIRPRGEILKLKQIKQADWQQVLKLTNEEFSKQYNIELDALNKLINEKPHKFEELDYKKKRFTRYFGNSRKYIQK